MISGFPRDVNELCTFDIHMSVHRNIIPSYNQQYATFLDLFISKEALHVSGGSSAHHQKHITVHTASGIVKPILLLVATVEEMEYSQRLLAQINNQHVYVTKSHLKKYPFRNDTKKKTVHIKPTCPPIIRST